MNFFSGSTDTRRTTQMVLMGIIILTLPCYCLGAVLLAYAPNDAPVVSVGSPTLGGMTQTPRLTPTFTPFFTYTFTPASGPLRPTAPPLYLPPATQPYYIPPPPTSIIYPTWPPAPTITSAPTLTLVPSPTLVPTSVPTDVPPPPTDAPLPTAEPLPTDEPPPTQEVLTEDGLSS